jgi:membrane protein YqaA with SNARE-associated domain
MGSFLRPRQLISIITSDAERLANHRWATALIFALELVGCTVFPIPVAIALVALVTAAPRRWVRFALGATFGSAVGAVVLYVIGQAFFESAGRWLISTYAGEERWAKVAGWYGSEWGLLLVLFASVTTGFFRVAGLAAGLTSMNPIAFLAAVSISRCARFMAECGAIRFVGERARGWSPNYFKYVTVGTIAALATAMILVALST